MLNVPSRFTFIVSFQVFQVTHQHFVRGHPGQQRRMGGGDGGHHFTAHLGNQRRQGKQQIGFGTDGDALADPLSGIAASTAAMNAIADGVGGLVDVALAGVAGDTAFRMVQ